MKEMKNKYHEDRPWGSFDQFTLNEISTVKILTVAPDQVLSLQYHHNRTEFWHVIDGSGWMTIGDTEKEAHQGDEFIVPTGEQHRIRAGHEGMRVLEIAYGIFDEDDIVRIEDQYGRT